MPRIDYFQQFQQQLLLSSFCFDSQNSENYFSDEKFLYTINIIRKQKQKHYQKCNKLLLWMKILPLCQMIITVYCDEYLFVLNEYKMLTLKFFVNIPCHLYSLLINIAFYGFNLYDIFSLDQFTFVSSNLNAG